MKLERLTFARESGELETALVTIIRPFQRTRTMNKATLLGFAVLGVLSWYPAAAAEQTPAGFDGAQWIWSSSDLGSMGAGVSYFRGGVDIPENPASEIGRDHGHVRQSVRVVRERPTDGRKRYGQQRLATAETLGLDRPRGSGPLRAGRRGGQYLARSRRPVGQVHRRIGRRRKDRA
jgi:hypothetical protein